jgi:selenocysteine lyase/cysteine desulfurase
VTPMDPRLSAGIVCFEVEDRPPPAVVDALMYARRISASVTPYAEQYVRMGPCILNSEAEIDETLRVLRAIL